jgi:hypothetical protein
MQEAKPVVQNAHLDIFNKISTNWLVVSRLHVREAMFRAAQLRATIALVLLASACTPQIRTQVTRFHHMPPTGSGETFAVVPIETQGASLEWGQYADLVAQQLTARGYVRLAQPLGASYAVLFSYAIDRGKNTTTAVPVFGQTGGGVTTFYSGSTSGVAYTQPTYGEVGSELVTTTTFARALELEIFDVPQTLASSAPAKIFEAKAGSAGSSGTLAAVMPAMIAAVFKDFPGKSGETIAVSAPIQR